MASATVSTSAGVADARHGVDEVDLDAGEEGPLQGSDMAMPLTILAIAIVLDKCQRVLRSGGLLVIQPCAGLRLARSLHRSRWLDCWETPR